jgi:hypothetical protein
MPSNMRGLMACIALLVSSFAPCGAQAAAAGEQVKGGHWRRCASSALATCRTPAAARHTVAPPQPRPATPPCCRPAPEAMASWVGRRDGSQGSNLPSLTRERRRSSPVARRGATAGAPAVPAASRGRARAAPICWRRQHPPHGVRRRAQSVAPRRRTPAASGAASPVAALHVRGKGHWYRRRSGPGVEGLPICRAPHHRPHPQPRGATAAGA